MERTFFNYELNELYEFFYRFAMLRMNFLTYNYHVIAQIIAADRINFVLSRLRLRNTQIYLVFRSACTTFHG